MTTSYVDVWLTAEESPQDFVHRLSALASCDADLLMPPRSRGAKRPTVSTHSHPLLLRGPQVDEVPASTHNGGGSSGDGIGGDKGGGGTTTSGTGDNDGGCSAVGGAHIVAKLTELLGMATGGEDNLLNGAQMAQVQNLPIHTSISMSLLLMSLTLTLTRDLLRTSSNSW